MTVNPPEPPGDPVDPVDPGGPAAPVPAPPQVPPRGSLWSGVGIGCGGYVLLALLMIPLLSTGLFQNMGAIIGFLLIPAVVALFLLAGERARRYGIGILIAAAAVWLVVIGPCMALLNGL